MAGYYAPNLLARTHSAHYCAAMSGENNRFEKKALRKVHGPKADWQALADSCVAFATAVGGTIAVGIEDDSDVPPDRQQVPSDLADTIRRRIRELTVNVSAEAEFRKAESGAEFIEVHIPRSPCVPSTTWVRNYLPAGDRNRRSLATMCFGLRATGLLFHGRCRPR